MSLEILLRNTLEFLKTAFISHVSDKEGIDSECILIHIRKQQNVIEYLRLLEQLPQKSIMESHEKRHVQLVLYCLMLLSRFANNILFLFHSTNAASDGFNF